MSQTTKNQSKSSFSMFISQFSHFLTGMGLAQILSLVSFPILTRVLTKDQYGILGLVTTTMLIAVAVSKAGLSDGIIRFYHEYSGKADRETIFSSTVFIRGVIFSVVAVLVYIALIPSLGRALKIQSKYTICFAVMTFYLFVRPLNIIVLNFLRVNGKTVFLNAANLLDKMLSVALSLFLLLYIFHDLYGYFIGVACAEFGLSLILFYWFFKNYKVRPAAVSGELAIKLIKFGLPLLLSECAFLALSYADRYLILLYYSESMLGLYSVGYNMAMYLVNIVMFSVSYSIVPIYIELYSKEGKEKTEAFLGKSLHYLLIAFIPMCFGYTAVVKDLLVILVSDKYSSAASFSPIILVGSVFFALNSLLNAGLYVAKKSKIILMIMLTAVAINVLLNVALLPKYGVTGAAIATLVPCALTTLLGSILGNKYIAVKIDFKKIFYYLLLSVVMYFAVDHIRTPILLLNLILKVLTGLLIIVVGTIYREEEVRVTFKRIFMLGPLAIRK